MHSRTHARRWECAAGAESGAGARPRRRSADSGAAGAGGGGEAAGKEAAAGRRSRRASMGRPAPRPLLLALLWLALCRGRVVRVPAGSLVRVVGTELVIPCNVSDYDGPSEQNFDWSFSSSGGSFVELASTWEVGFGAQLYRERLQRGEILLRRTANDAVELHIKDVQPSDQGHYKCSTPSTDATVQGNYEDTVQVKVLADALHVAASPLSSPGPGLGRSLSLHLGEPFELRCEAATTSPLHTHLALLWELRHGAARQRVLALTREGRLHPGPGYEQRYHGGDVRLDTVGSDGYRLSVNRALAADQGTYRCVVSEWIEEQGACSAALIGRTPGGSGVVTSGPRRQQRKPSGGHLGSVRLGGAGSGGSAGGQQAEAEAESEPERDEQLGAGAASTVPSMVGARSPRRPVSRPTSCTSSSAFSSGSAGGAVWRPRR